MTDLHVYIEGVSDPFVLRYHDLAKARDMAVLIGVSATNMSGDAAPFVDDMGNELSFVLSTLRAIHLLRDF